MESPKHSLIPSFLYSSSSFSLRSLLLDQMLNSNPDLHKSPSPSPPTMLSQKNFLIASPTEPGKGIEMYSPAFYAACTFGGILSCGLTHMAVTPLDLVKCNMQTQSTFIFPFLCDEAMDPMEQDEPEPEEMQIQVPILRRSPRTRSGTQAIQEEFNNQVESLITLLHHDELKQDLLTKKIMQEIPIGPEAEEDVTNTNLDVQSLRRNSRKEVIQPKIQFTSFLPILEGAHQPNIFYISKQGMGQNLYPSTLGNVLDLPNLAPTSSDLS